MQNTEAACLIAVYPAHSSFTLQHTLHNTHLISKQADTCDARAGMSRMKGKRADKSTLTEYNQNLSIDFAFNSHAHLTHTRSTTPVMLVDFTHMHISVALVSK